MSGHKITRLIPAQDRINRSSAAQIGAALTAIPGLNENDRQRALHALYRISEPDHSRAPWGTFVMLSVQQIDAIWDTIHALPPKQRPHDVRRVLDKSLVHLRQDTGEIMLTRLELSEATGIAENNVTKAMSVLANLGVIIKGERRKYPGLKGPGLATYFINPHAAWNGALALRSVEAEKQPTPLLRLMQGGKADPQ